MVQLLLFIAMVLQAIAVAYGIFLASRQRGALGAWLFLLGGMSSMLTWRVVVVAGIHPPDFFNPLIAIWGSSCMFGAMALFAREVTRRQKAETERDALLDSERAARAEAERAMKSKDDFLGTLSHELRTPLTAILGWTTLARMRRSTPDEVLRAVDTIERNARAQSRLIDDLLDVTRMQAGRLHLELAQVRLDEPVQAALQAIRPQADARKVTLELKLPSEPPQVRGDAGRLQQIASNLLTNAVKFSEAGGRVELELRTVDGRVELSVRDFGEGLDPAFVPHLFNRFQQAETGSSRRHGGLGLGLSIVASLARLHGGDVRAESGGPGKGSTFTVTLPLAVAAEGAVPGVAPVAPAVAVSDTALAGLRFIVVDDEQDVRTAVSLLLERMGSKVLALGSGATLEAALTEHQPHALLIDIGMPGEDGYSLLKRVRQLPAERGGTVPAISLTAHARPEDRQRALETGFQEHLTKPIDVALLVSSIRRIAAPAE